MELVANALDAGATEVDVELDLRGQDGAEGLCFRVCDNGAGIAATRLQTLALRRSGAPDDLHLVQALGAASATTERYMKPPLPRLGYRGEALALVREASAALVVSSRAADSFETHAVLLQPGQPARQGLAPEQRSRQGTAVSVRGLFCGQPVRRKALVAGG